MKPITAVALATLALTPTTLVARADDDVRAQVDRLVSPLIEGEIAPSLVVGVIKDGQRHVYGYGELPDGSTPDERTVYEIGSITKGFTGLLLADAIVRDKLALEDPVDTLWPEGYTPPSFDGQPVTFLDLATHHAGIPRVPSNMRADDLTDPYAEYHADDMYTYLNGYRPAVAPGKVYAYSNLGMGLLGDLLATKAGLTYDELLAERITKPLAMTSTSAVITDAQKARLAPGHRDGNPTPSWHFGCLAGCGAIRSDARDMLTLAQALLDPEGSPLEDAIELATTPRRGVTGSPARVGLGWMIAGDGQTVFHNGQTGGYSSMMLANPPGGIAVVIMAGAANGLVDAVGEQIIQALFGMPVQPLDIAKPVEVSAEALRRLEGDYVSDAGFTIRVKEADGQLMCNVIGQPAWPASPKSATEFAHHGLGVLMVFHAEEGEPPTSMTFTQNARSFECPRAGTP